MFHCSQPVVVVFVVVVLVYCVGAMYACFLADPLAVASMAVVTGVSVVGW